MSLDLSDGITLTLVEQMIICIGLDFLLLLLPRTVLSLSVSIAQLTLNYGHCLLPSSLSHVAHHVYSFTSVGTSGFMTLNLLIGTLFPDLIDSSNSWPDLVF